ncbi:Carboxylesterase [Neofusicoccum parvum]|nr:Carboxylesterase [Neofusicoccum parvum]
MVTVPFAVSFYIRKNGMGYTMTEIPLDVFLTGRQWFWASSWMYYLGLGLSKLSVTLQFFRIFVTPKTLLVTKGTIAFVCSWTVIAVCVAAFECIPVEKYWNRRLPGKCINGRDTFLANAVMNIATDFIIIGIPVPSLMKLQVGLAKKLGLMFAFSLGMVVCAISIARIPMVMLAFKAGKPGNLSLMMWSAIELNVAIICACLPSIRPLFVSFLRFTGLDTYMKTITRTSGAKSNSKRAAVEYIEMEDGVEDRIKVQRSVEVKSEIFHGSESRSRQSDEDSIDRLVNMPDRTHRVTWLNGPLIGAVVAAGPTVTVKNGTLEGVHSPQYDQDFFLGIPFAQPPVGDLRFRQAQPINTTWDGVKSANTYSVECVGYGSDQFFYQTSEDCLYLNVIRPAEVDDYEPLPVAVWIHGGGFTQGGGVDQRYNMSFIIQNGVEIGKPFIGVSLNYRLSAWGFLMGEEVQDSGNTNIGLRDQRLALEWVQENIAAFGGDPSKVTIFGESAGAMSVGFHLVAYGGRDDRLFRGAIMQSGAPVYYTRLNDSSQFEPKYQSFLSATGCADLSCLRALPYADLNKAINQTQFINWGPAIDRDLIQGLTSTQLLAGKFIKVPVISGANSDEGTAFGPSGIDTEADFVNALTSLSIPPTLTPSILTAYPDTPSLGIPGSFPSGPLPPTFRFSLPQGAQYRRSAAYHGDHYFVANRRLVCQTWAAWGVAAYCYRFNAVPNGVPWARGATHFQEVAFVFRNELGVGYEEPVARKPFAGKPASYVELAAMMTGMWAAFVVDLDPNAWAEGAEGEGEGGEEEDRDGPPGAAWMLGPGGGQRWPKYDLFYPTDFVFDANVTSYVEMDTYRAAGIALINANAAKVLGR